MKRNFNEQYPKIELVVGISKWTNPSKSQAVHLVNAKRMPLCGRVYSSHDVFFGEAKKVTCGKCISLANKFNK